VDGDARPGTAANGAAALRLRQDSLIHRVLDHVDAAGDRGGGRPAHGIAEDAAWPAASVCRRGLDRRRLPDIEHHLREVAGEIEDRVIRSEPVARSLSMFEVAPALVCGALPSDELRLAEDDILTAGRVVAPHVAPSDQAARGVFELCLRRQIAAALLAVSTGPRPGQAVEGSRAIAEIIEGARSAREGEGPFAGNRSGVARVGARHLCK
jgi:hypothetical protein